MNTTELTINEAHEYVTSGTLPHDFKDRCELLLQGVCEQWLWCDNCGGVGCMHMVMRDWWAGSGVEDCDGHCCPDCGDFWRTEGGGK